MSSSNQNNLFSSSNIKDNNSENNKTQKNKEDNTQPSSKSISLSKILSLRFQSETFLEEFLSKFNHDDNLKVIKNSINVNNCNDFIIDTILSSKKKEEEYKAGEHEEDFGSIMKEKRNLQKIKKK